MQKYQRNIWYAFWKNLKQGYDFFEQQHRPPNVEVQNKKYIFSVD